MAPTYATYQVPRTLDAASLAIFVKLNREAIRSIPGLVLFRTHELAWTEADWREQLQDPHKVFFVCVTSRRGSASGSGGSGAANNNSDIRDASLASDGAPNGTLNAAGTSQHDNDNDAAAKVMSCDSDERRSIVPTLEGGRWVGLCACVGPLDADEYRLGSGHNAALGERETRWHGGRIFLRPAHRSVQAFGSMIEACAAFIRDFTPKHLDLCAGTCIARMHTTLAAGSEMEGLYRSNGAEDRGRVTLCDSLRASRSLHHVPPNTLSPADYTARDRLLLEWVLRC